MPAPHGVHAAMLVALMAALQVPAGQGVCCALPSGQ
jgi:hypothetical protein